MLVHRPVLFHHIIATALIFFTYVAYTMTAKRRIRRNIEYLIQLTQNL